MPIEIAELVTRAEVHEAATLFAAVWSVEPAAAPVGPELLMAFAHAGNYVAGAFAGSRMVGASAAFVCRQPARTLHSHITGVLPDVAGDGVGTALKHHQRAWAAAHDIDAITWTFDPLVRRNAWFNIAKLGATVVEYLVDFYGPMRDGINRGDASDRLLVRWSTDSRTVVAAAPPPTTVECPTPDDIAALRVTDPSSASSWRLRVRRELGDRLTMGYRVLGFSRDGSYELGR